MAQGRVSRNTLVWIALSAVYVVWGSTYLAIRVAIETIPPLLMASIRFLIAGGLLYAWSIRRGDRDGDRPGATQWRAALIIGGALLLGGNGGVVLAERTVASGIAALLVATVPLWMAIFDRIVFGQRLARPAVVGLALGFGGMVLLTRGSGSERIDPAGTALVLFAALSWAAGSLYARRAPLPSRPLLSTAMQMLGGGALLGVAGIARGELDALHAGLISGRSLLALAYLIGFGALVGFTCYAWLLRAARTSIVSTYAYVNPVVAVLLGWAFLGERVTARTLVAGLVVVVAVMLIVTARAAPAPAPEAIASEPVEYPSGR